MVSAGGVKMGALLLTTFTSKRWKETQRRKGTHRIKIMQKARDNGNKEPFYSYI